MLQSLFHQSEAAYITAFAAAAAVMMLGGHAAARRCAEWIVKKLVGQP